jgi:hypothetical protein
MKVKDYWSVHYELTGITSSILRTLVLSGVAAVWLFHRTSGDKVVNVPLAIYALLAFSTAVALDLLQYAWSGWVYGRHATLAEKHGKGQDDDLPNHPAWYNLPTYILYWAKLVLTLAGYGFLAAYLSRLLLVHP